MFTFFLLILLTQLLFIKHNFNRDNAAKLIELKNSEGSAKENILKKSENEKNCDKTKKFSKSNFTHFQNNYRNYCSFPFSTILDKSIKAFPANKDIFNAKKEIEILRKMDIALVSDYFAYLSIENISEYWYYFYILANVSLKGKLDYNKKEFQNNNNTRHKNLFIPNINNSKDIQIEDLKLTSYNNNKNMINISDDYIIPTKWILNVQNYKLNKLLNQLTDATYYKIIIKDFEYKKKLDKCKINSLKLLKRNLIFLKEFNEENRGLIYKNIKHMNLNSFNQTLVLRKIIKTLPFYKKLDTEFPKGILTHFHWPGAFTGKTLFNSILELLKNKTILKNNFAILKVDLLRPSKINNKVYLDIPTQFFFIIDNLTELRFKKLYLIKYEKLFINQYVLKETKYCLASPRNGLSEISNLNIRAFLFLKHCSNIKIFVDFDFTKEHTLKKLFNGLIPINRIKKNIFKIKSKYLLKLFENSRYFYEEKEILIEKYLPEIYSKNMSLNIHEKLETAVWFKFENIFLNFENLIYHKEVFNLLNQHLKKNFIRQKINGVEIRIFNQGDVVKEMNKVLLSEINNKTSNDSKTMEEDELKVGFIFYGTKNKFCHCTKNIIESQKLSNMDNQKENNFDEMACIIIDDKYNVLKDNRETIEKKKKNINMIGIDYVGFEDDPFSGARNFFDISILNNTSRGNDQIDKNLNSLYTMINKDQYFHNKTLTKNLLNKNNQNSINNTTTRISEENTTNEDYFADLFNFLKNNSSLPLFYHAGETRYFPNHPVDDNYISTNYINDNVLHAILLPNVKRIGHGISAIKNELILEIMRKKNIALEFSPISNQDLFYYKLEKNPIMPMIKLNFPITINSDDPGFFGYEGVTMDWFYLLMLNKNQFQPSEIYSLIKNSLNYSGLKFEKNEKKKILFKIQNDFFKFFDDLEC